MLQEKKGSMLLEGLLAVLVMAIGTTVLMQALMNNAHVVNGAQDYGRAWLLINEKLEEKFFFDTSNIPLDQPVTLSQSTYRNRIDFKTLTQAPWGGLKQMDIAVEWPNGKTNRNVSLRTILPDDKRMQTTTSIFYN